jgi:hypothetical protein
VPRWRLVLGWTAVALYTAAAGFWAVWGSIEAFHEGWYSRSLWQNLALTFGQYLSPMIALAATSALAIRFQRAALPVFWALALGALWLFTRSPAGILFIVLPLTLLGVLYRVGLPRPRRWALAAVLGLPLATALVCGAVPGWRALHRLDDGNYGMRLVEGNGVRLVWAPEGPGWPGDGVTWWDARRRCAYLAADGRTIAPTAQNLWRLPTLEEAVRSLVYRGANAGGTWDGHAATYRVQPDKDSPLWKRYSRVIYWWTATEAPGDRAWRIAYNGTAYPLGKRGWGSYWSCRCVREP